MNPKFNKPVKLSVFLFFIFSLFLLRTTGADSQLPTPSQVGNKENIVKIDNQKTEKKTQRWEKPKTKQRLDIQAVFKASPIIYSILLCLSIFALTIWLFTILSFRNKKMIDKKIIEEIKNSLIKNEYEKALEICKKSPSPLTSMVASGLLNRKRGYQIMIEAVKSEGERITASKWQKLAWLNDITVISPMLGLLGTILGIFYAFYDMHRSVESIIGVFDGIGIAVGTTVAGLVVAILSMILHATLRSHLSKILNTIETETILITQEIKE